MKVDRALFYLGLFLCTVGIALAAIKADWGMAAIGGLLFLVFLTFNKDIE